jgi:hypothetical protein
MMRDRSNVYMMMAARHIPNLCWSVILDACQRDGDVGGVGQDGDEEYLIALPPSHSLASS